MRHSLKLDFANTGRVDPRITVERAGSQSYFDEFGVMRFASPNMLAIDHDPVTHECLGASIWGARTNLLTYSADFNDAAWVKAAGITVASNTVFAPDGTTSADKIIYPVTSQNQYVTRNLTTVSGEEITFSVYLKTAQFDNVLFYFNGTTTSAVAGVLFNLSAVTKIKNSTIDPESLVSDYEIESVGNGWYRCSVTLLAAANDGSLGITLRYTNNGAGLSAVSGDGTSGIYVWGAQFESGVNASPYIPTTTSQVTRPATIAKIDGTKFTDFYNQTEGTFVAVGKGKKNSPLCSVDGADAYYRLTLGRIADGRAQFYCRNNGTGDTSLNNTGDVGDGFYRMASAYKINDAAQSTNGATCITGAPSALATPTRLSIGQYISALSQCDGHIKSITYYPIRLSNETLKALAK